MDKKDNCNGLDCKDCSGCAYGTLAAFYKAKKTLSNFIGENIVNNYIYIGSLDIKNEIIKSTNYKRYIASSEDNFFVYVYNFEKQNWDKRKLNETEQSYINKLYIEHFLPHQLQIPGNVSQVYGIVDNRGAIWNRRDGNTDNYSWGYFII